MDKQSEKAQKAEQDSQIHQKGTNSKDSEDGKRSHKYEQKKETKAEARKRLGLIPSSEVHVKYRGTNMVYEYAKVCKNRAFFEDNISESDRQILLEQADSCQSYLISGAGIAEEE